MNTEETQNFEPNPQRSEAYGDCDNLTTTLRDELIRLSVGKEIKYSEKYIKKASQEALEKIKQDYQRKQMDTVNSQLTENLITKFSELMKQLNMVENNEKLDKELSSNKVLYDDVKVMVQKISPYIPMIGLVSGGLIVAKHMWTGRNKDDEVLQSNETVDSNDSGVDVTNSDNDRVDTS